MARVTRQRSFVMIFQEAYEDRLIEFPLSHFEQRLLNVCLTRCVYGGDVPLNHREIGALSGMYPADVSRGMKRLALGGYVLRERGKGNQWKYRLPTTLFHRGHLDELVWRRYKDMIAVHAQQLSEKPDDS